MKTSAKRHSETRLKGTPVCRGVAIGRPFLFSCNDDDGYSGGAAAEGEGEVRRYRKALERCRGDIERLREQMDRERIVEGAAILDAHLQILEDPLLTTEIEETIAREGKSAEVAFQLAINAYKKKFDALGDAFFRERFKDIQDVAKRIIGHLRHSVRSSLIDVAPGTVVFANEISASDAAEADPERVVAFVTEAGGLSTHAAIVAKAKGIPYIARVPLSKAKLDSDAIVIVDARTGDVIFNPAGDTIAVYDHIQRQLAVHVDRLEKSSRCSSETIDGLALRLSANVEAIEEIPLMRQYGGSGVGLLRTENIFLFNDTFPSEEEQTLHYRAYVEAMGSLPLTVRTFDIGGDKSFMGRVEGSDEPFFVGCRAIRFLLQERSIFKRQLRAILRAAHGANVSVLFPMISSLPELRDAKGLLFEARDELRSEGVPCLEELRVGCMIEVPSAAVITDVLAKECDFLSIGTNDLVHYSLAVDRAHQPVSPLYANCHPCLLRLIRMVVYEANLCGIPVSVCGEIASDPRFTALLIGLGVHELSVACRYLPLIKNAIRSTSAVAAIQLAQEALQLGTSYEVQQLLSSCYRDAVPDDCFYNY